MKNYFFYIILISIFALNSTHSFSQSVGIGETSFEPNKSAALEIRATQKGILIPKLTDQQRNNINTPIEGLLIYQVNLVSGFYYYNGTTWERLGSFYVDYDTDSLNEIQSISISNDTVYLQNGGFVKLPQDLVDDADNNPNNEIQVLSISNDTVYLQNGGFVKLPQDLVDDADNNPNNEIQALSISNDTVYLQNGGFVKLPQDLVDDADNNPNNEIQAISISNDTVYLQNGGFVKLPQDLVDDADNNPNNEIQALSISNDTVYLQNGGFVKLPQDLVDDADNNPNNEIQAISISSDTVYLQNGGFVKLPQDLVDDADNNPNNEIQAITISNDTVYLQNGGFVKLPQDLVDDADSDTLNEIQTLSFSNDTLQITKANLVDLSSIKDDLGSHILTQNLQLNGFSIGNDSTPSFYIDSVGKLVFLKGTSIQNNFTIDDTLIVNSSVYFNQRVYINQDDPDHTNLPTAVPDELTVVGDSRFYDDNIGFANPDFARITFTDPSSALNDGVLNIYTPNAIEFGKISQAQQSNGSSLMRINEDGTVKINNQYNLPNNDGNKRQVLTTNGNDTLYWSNVAELDTVSVESGSFIAFAGYEYLLDGNLTITITLPDAATNKNKKIVFYTYQYDATNGFFFDVQTNVTSILSVADANAVYTTTNEFGVVSTDKTVTLISNGIHWVMLGAKD